MIDLRLLQIVRVKDDFRRLYGRIPKTSLNAQTVALLEDFDKYWKKFPDHKKINIATFLPMFRSWHPTLDQDTAAAYEAILQNIKQDVSDEVRTGVMDTMLELRLGTELAELLGKYDAGEIHDIKNAIDRIVGNFTADATGQSVDYILDDIEDLLDEELDDSGIHWRLDILNRHMRGLRGGDFGIIAARPDKGKTTLIASEVTHMASQLPEGQCVLWLNNEGPGKRIKPRLYQAAFGATLPELGAIRRGGLLHTGYAERVGAASRIRIVDVHGRDAFTIEQIIERNNAGIVIYDMIDGIRGFGDMPRTDLMLEEMYKHFRTVSVKHNVIGLATSQISHDGEGLQFPGQSCLKDSKTGKQGACDFIMMIGSSNDPSLDGIRYIGLPKNKLRKAGAPGDPKAQVHYQPDRVRYSDIPYASEDDDDIPGHKG